MVATRRGVRVYSPNTTNSDESSAVQATPSTGRRTRSAAKQVETPSAQGETSSQPGEGGTPSSPQSQSSRKRCTKASRLHSPELPSTPVGSTHEADVSDLESCCSAVSDIEPPLTRRRTRSRQPHSVNQTEDDVFDAESCSSAVSTSEGEQSIRRSPRKNKGSDSQRVSKSLRKRAHTGSAAKRQIEHPEPSDADSCTSSVSGAEACMSTTGRATRSRKRVQPIPLYLDEASEGSRSPAPLGRTTRAARGKAGATVVVTESQSCDSEGFESGPSMTPQRTSRRRGKARSTGPKAVGSDSELTDMHSPLGSPSPTRSRGTIRLSAKALSIVLERAVTPGAQTGGEESAQQVNSQSRKVTVSEPAEEEDVLYESRLESTVTADLDCTLLEGDKTLTLEEDKTSTDLTSNDILSEDAEVIKIGRRGSVTMSVTADVEMGESTAAPQESTNTTAMEKAVTIIPLEDEEMDPPADYQVFPSHPVTLSDSPSHTEEAQGVSEPTVTTRDQQREPSVKVTVCQKILTSEATEETDESDKAMEINGGHGAAQQVVGSREVPGSCTELSDADSCTSSVSGAEACMSTTGRATRSRRRVQPVPLYLGEASEGSRSPAPLGRITRAARGKAAATVVVTESQSCDSEGFEAGPNMTPQRTRRGKARSTGPKASTVTADSDRTLLEEDTPQRTRRGKARSTGPKASTVTADCTLLEEDTPQRTRRGKARSTGPKASTVTADCTLLEEDTPQRTRRGKARSTGPKASTVTADSDCTLLEEDKTSTDLTSNDILSEDAEVIEIGRRGSVTMSVTADVEMGESTAAPQESTNTTAMEKAVTIIPLEDEEMDPPADYQVCPSHPVTLSDSPSHTEEAQGVSEPAVTTSDQQREPSAENEDGVEVAVMQETVPSSEPLELASCQSATVTVCEKVLTPEATEENEESDKAMEINDMDTHPSQTERLQEKPLDGGTIAETLPGGDEEMEVSASRRDAQAVVGSREVPGSEPTEPDQVQGESIQVTSSQEQKVTVEPGSKQKPTDTVIVQNKTTISLLESSEDEDEYVEEEEEGPGEEEEDDLGQEEEEGGRAGPSKMSETASASVDGLFMIDTRPGQEADEQYYKAGPCEKGTKGEEDEEDEEEFVDEEGDDDDDDEDSQILFYSRNPQSKELSSRIDPGLRMKELGGLYINFDGSKSKPVSSSLKKLKEQKIQDEVMKRSVIGPDFEKKDAVPPYSEAKQALKCKRKAEREKTTGDSWFNMKAPELTEELKGDLKVLKMRGSLDPKRFYKKNDRDGFPKYFQVGTVMDNPADFYHSRVPKKARKRTMVEELLADAELRQNNKRKYQQIMTEKAAQGAGKRNKNRSKFHKKN